VLPPGRWFKPGNSPDRLFAAAQKTIEAPPGLNGEGAAKARRESDISFSNENPPLAAPIFAFRLF
jgi:hypothetical protein